MDAVAESGAEARVGVSSADVITCVKLMIGMVEVCSLKGHLLLIVLRLK